MASPAPQYILEDPHAQLLTIQLTNAGELFILGHEYGHIICGHGANKRMVDSEIANEKVSEIIYSWEQEFQADSVGLTLLVEVNRKSGIDLALSYVGAEMFFTFADIAERAMSVIRTGDEEVLLSKSHPPAYMRREKMRSAMGQAATGASFGFGSQKLVEGSSVELQRAFARIKAEGAVDLAKKAEQNLSGMWRMVKPALYKLRQEGRIPAPHWKDIASSG